MALYIGRACNASTRGMFSEIDAMGALQYLVPVHMRVVMIYVYVYIIIYYCMLSNGRFRIRFSSDVS